MPEAIENTGRVEESPPDPADGVHCRRQLWLMSSCFGLNHATVTTPIIYASTVLTNEAGQLSNALLYGTTLVCSLFFANLAFAVLGPKRGLSLSMLLYAVYVALFATATSACASLNDKGKCVEGGASQMLFALVGAGIGGIGAGVLWTCQGAYLSRVIERVAKAERKEESAVSGELSGSFALVFLVNESAIRALTTLLKKYAGLDSAVVFYLYAGLALLAVLVFFFLASEMHQTVGVTRPGSILDKTLAAVSLWKDPNIWLLQATNITFGFAAAWLGAYVGEHILTPALGASFIGFAGALLSMLAAVLSKVFGCVAPCTGKTPIVFLGVLAFTALGVLSKWVGEPSKWGWGAMVFYLCMGVGRAVYESTNKAIFVDFFPPAQRPGAFANVFVFGTAASTVGFILGSQNKNLPELYMMLGFAWVTVPFLLLATRLKRRRSDAAERESLVP